MISESLFIGDALLLPITSSKQLSSFEQRRQDYHRTLVEEFKETIQIATRFLDNVIDYNLDRHALDSQKQNAENDRRIGLGILGLGDMLVRMQIKYDSEDALQTVDQVLKIFRDTAYETSKDLAIEKGVFPNYNSQIAESSASNSSTRSRLSSRTSARLTS